MSRDWNSAYENEDTPWDKGYAAPPLAEFFESLRSQKPGRRYQLRRMMGSKLLVPGCGTGHDVRLLAKQGAEVTGLDIAPKALKKAAAFPPADNERYAQGDFLDLGEPYHGFFDWVVEHTCLCAIEPSERPNYVRSLVQALKPGGHYLAVFFREVSNYTGEGPPHPISAEAIELLFGREFEVLECFVPQQTYPSRPVGCEEVRLMRLRGA